MMVEASAPSNIALIKYMGKTNVTTNVPTNSSLSWTLPELRTFVRITERGDFSEDQWQALSRPGLSSIKMSDSSIRRYLKHFKNLKDQWNIKHNFLIESANNFPSDCGLASSASSFAALTKAAVEIFQEISPRDEIGLSEMSQLSRQGSGSSCRSFFGPWALWHKEGVRPLEFPMPELLHQVVIVTDKKKTVSSSDAHRLVATSPLFVGRVERAEKRLAEITFALKNNHWRDFFDLAWAEFIDMHSLFETSNPPFRYLEPESQQVLDRVMSLWNEMGDGPVVTMDAGANVHLLWRSDQLVMAKKLSYELSKKFRLQSCLQITEALKHEF